MVPEDETFYHQVKLQHSLFFRSLHYTESKEMMRRLFTSDVFSPHVFYCLIEDTQKHLPVGFIMLKDKTPWEVGIELDDAYIRQGYGSRSIRLF